MLIILGDAGINFSGGIRDVRTKEFLETLLITIFAIHGNHEQRPQTIDGYKEKLWHGGVVYYEEEFDLGEKQAIVMGGAYSINKMVRLIYGYGWWEDEQHSEEIKKDVECWLDELGGRWMWC